MAIVQISKIQQRSGNLVDLPQLDEAEMGWASDAKRLFIGKTTPNENVEVLTSYSNISFSQVDGSFGNLDISNAVVTGQVMAYDKVSNTWINTGGNALDPGNASYFSNSPIHLGNVANVKIGGGAIGYVLETDGQGNLSWTSKGTLRANILGITHDTGNANIILVTVANTTPYTNGTAITISGANGVSNTVVNGNTFYVKVASDFATSGNVRLYSDVSLTTAATSTNISYTNSPNALAITSLGSSGAAAAGGSNTTIQFNNNNILDGDADFTYNFSTNLLTLNGNANVANLNSSGVVTAANLVSNIATGTPPLTVTSTTRVSNLSVAYSNVSDFGVTTVQTTGSFFPVFVNSSATGNRALAANANLGFNAATGNLSATILNANGAIAAGTTVTATGNVTGSNLLTAGNVTASRLISNVATGTAPLTVTSTTRVSNLSVDYANVSDFGVVTAQTTGTYYPTFVSSSTTGNKALSANSTFSANLANGALIATTFVGALSGAATSATTAGTVTTAAQGNITSVGTLTSLGVNGTITAVAVTANTGVFTGNGSGLSAIAGANVTGTVANATYAVSAGTAGTVTTAAQPNITSVSTSFTSLTFANAQTISGNNMSLTTGANTNAGTITGNWSLSTGSKLQATYADLAEYYEADAEYEPGTVLAFGGDKEVTIAEDGTTRVAGVVSTDPAYAMNAKCPGIAVALALQGRVPTKVRGVIRKGDMMVSAGNGFARPWNNPAMGTVIGKALEDFDGVEGIIEVAVGRL
jgi:hypothetical protein